MNKREVQEWLSGLKWDGVDRLSAYVGLDRLPISPDAQLQRQRVQKWLAGLPKVMRRDEIRQVFERTQKEIRRGAAQRERNSDYGEE